jgi:hypothetical protein
MFGEADLLVADDVLGFAGISPPTLRVYPIETHIAEKLHAYTLPRKRPNSRITDGSAGIQALECAASARNC